MISLVAATAILLIGQDPNLGKVIPKFTGNNGYEEYVRAALMLDQPRAKALDAYVAARESGSAAVSPPEGVDPRRTLLELYRLQVKETSSAIDLIRQGNLKPVRYPQTRISPATLFPELAVLKRAGRIFARNMYVELADGDTSGATRDFVEALKFGRNVQIGGGFIHLLVGQAIHGSVYKVFDLHHDQFSLKDVQTIGAWVRSDEEVLRMRATDAARVEAASMRVLFDDFFTDPTEFVEPEELSETKAMISRVPVAKRDGFYNAVFKRLESPYRALAYQFQQPEPEWLKPIDSDTFVEDADYTGMPEGSVPLGMALLKLYGVLGASDTNERFGAIVVRFAVQERLLRLYAAVLGYRWTHGQLPATMTEATGKDLLDPASRMPYVYETNGITFRIGCDLPGVGMIGLSGPTRDKLEDPIPPL